VPLDEYLELKQPDQAANSHRRGSALDAMKAYYDALVELKAGEHLIDLLPGNDAGPVAVEAWQPAADERLGKATALRDLAKMDDADFPWRRYASAPAGQSPEPSYRVQLAVAEEQYVQRLDESENAAAYHIDPQAAEVALATAEARVLALRDVVAELEAKAPAEATPNRAARRAAARSGGAPAVPTS
jgi:hypothetical protein